MAASTASHASPNESLTLLAFLFAIKKSGTGTGSTEVHVLSAPSNYQRFTLQTGTALHETGSAFEYALASNRNLIAIKKRGTDTRD